VFDASSQDEVIADGIYVIVDGGKIKIRPGRALLFADDNANTRFQLIVSHYDPEITLFDAGELVVGGTVIRMTGPSSVLYWTLGPDNANKAAGLLNVPRQDRHPVADMVVGTFAPTQKTYTAGQAVEVVLTLSNPAEAPAVKFTAGGHQRGPRNNQFSFALTRDGSAVPPITAYDFGGIATMPTLNPGGKAEPRTPLAGWGDVTVRGHYVVQCRWESAFSPDDVDPYDEHHRGDIWDKAFVGTISFDVR
jgi:hypothetical protein